MQKLPRELEALRLENAAITRQRNALAARTDQFKKRVAYLHGEKAYTYSTIASALGVSRGRAQQLAEQGNVLNARRSR